MTLDDLSRTTGEWLRGAGNMCDVVVSSRVRLARNLADCPFLTTATATERTEIYRNVVEAITTSSAGDETLLVDVDTADPLDRELLVERHLISRQHLSAEGSRGVAFSLDETRALMINEEDHLRIQAIRSGLELDTSFQDVNRLDDTLGERLQFAFDQRLGYLTACPTNVGTGIRVSVMLHLPALKWTREIERVVRAARDMRLAVRGLYGEGAEIVGDLYQISNQTTLGKAEPDLIKEFHESIVPKIVDYERSARDALARRSPHELDDKIWRAYGVLSQARRITSEETQTMMSPLRLGIQMERFDAIDLKTLNDLFLHTQPAHLQKQQGCSLDDDQRDVARADFLRARL